MKIKIGVMGSAGGELGEDICERVYKLGKEIAECFGLGFLEEDFKEDDGFRKSVELSKAHELYRQVYCGCAFSGLAFSSRKREPSQE